MRLIRGLLVSAMAITPVFAGAQTAAEHLALGDKDYAAARVDAALRHYEAVIALEPKHYEALYRASRSEIDLGEVEADKNRRQQRYRKGEELARRAVEARPDDAEGHFHLARALGRMALSLGPRDRVKYGTAVHNEAMAALKINPRHPGALHIMGVWNAEIMRLNGFTRFIARTFLGGRRFDSASWKEAVRYMEEAVAVEPWRIVHRLDLAQIYADVGDKVKAREQFEQILKLPNADPNDPVYRKQAEAALKKL